jgi:hypothetical protein
LPFTCRNDRCQPLPLDWFFPDTEEVTGPGRSARGAAGEGCQAGARLAVQRRGQTSCASLKDRGPRDAAPTTSPRDPRTAPPAESAAVFSAREVPSAHTSSERPSRRAAPAGGAKRGPLRLSLDRAQPARLAADFQPLQHSAPMAGHTTAVASLHGFERDLTAKLPANRSDSCRSAATSADEHERSTCRDGRQRTTLDGRGRVRSPPVLVGFSPGQQLLRCCAAGPRGRPGGARRQRCRRQWRHFPTRRRPARRFRRHHSSYGGPSTLIVDSPPPARTTTMSAGSAEGLLSRCTAPLGT